MPEPCSIAVVTTQSLDVKSRPLRTMLMPSVVLPVIAISEGEAFISRPIEPRKRSASSKRSTTVRRVVGPYVSSRSSRRCIASTIAVRIGPDQPVLR